MCAQPQEKYSLASIVTKVAASLGIREGESLKVVSLFLYLVLVISSYVISKTVRDALFLSRFDVSQLPSLYIVIAVCVSVVGSLYIRLAAHIRPRLLVSLTLLFFASNLLVFRWLSEFDYVWLYPVIYVWAGIFGVIAPMQVWTVASLVLTTRQAKRLYGFIGSGGLLGAIAGGLLSSWTARTFGTENLLLVVAVFLFFCVFLSSLIWTRNELPTSETESETEGEAETKEAPGSVWDSVALVAKSPYLMLITALISLGAIGTTIVDYQFKAVAQGVLTDKDQLTIIFGNVYGYLGICAFVLQLLLTSRIMRRLGVGFTILLLPTGLIFGSLALLATLSLWSAIALKGMDQLFKHSIDKSSIEILYLPLPARIRTAVKSFIDTVVWRLADGAGGLILLLLTTVLALSVRQVALVNMGILGAWFLVAWNAKNRYVDALRKAITEQPVTDNGMSGTGQADEYAAVVASLQDGVPEEILTSLEQLALLPNRHELIGPLEKLLEHPAAAVRAKAVNLLFDVGDFRLAGRVREMLNDASLEVQGEALRFVTAYGDRDALDAVKAHLEALKGNFTRGVVGSLTRDVPETSDRKVTSPLKMPGALPQAAPVSHTTGSALRTATGSLIGRATGSLRKGLSGRLAWPGSVQPADESRPDSTELLVEMARSNDVSSRREAARLILLSEDPAPLYPTLNQLLLDRAEQVVRLALQSAASLQRRQFVPAIIACLGRNELRESAEEVLNSYGKRILGTLRDYLVDEETRFEIRLLLPQVIGHSRSQEAVNILCSNLMQPNPQLRLMVLKALNKLRTSAAPLHFPENKIRQTLNCEVRHYFENLYLLQSFTNENADTFIAGNSGALAERFVREKLEMILERIFRLLGLIYMASDLYQSYLGVMNADPLIRANTLEFLDNLLDPDDKQWLMPMIDEDLSLKERLKQAQEFGIAPRENLTQSLNQLFEVDEQMRIQEAAKG